MLKEGQKAPDFAIRNSKDSAVRLSDYAGKKVVLYFYPKNNTPSCSREASGFRDLYQSFQEHNTEVVGVSIDSVASHTKFKDKLDLPFQLLSDADKALTEAYDVWKEKSMYGKTYMGVERTTFVIDGKGTIRKIYPKVKVKDHAEEVLQFVKALDA